ncbi:MAG: hypothetical protein ACREN5_14915 [Gemmatimonadales bacterium]
MFERLKAAINAAIDSAMPPDDLRARAARMQEAVVEARLSVDAMRRGLAQTSGELALERQRLADAERRGRLAGEIQDAETVRVALQFTERHRERVLVLEKKLAVQHEELGLAERELEEMKGQLKSAVQDRPATEAGRAAEQAWRDLQRAGGTRPDLDLEGELLKAQMNRRALEAEADEQLKALKKKMGK